MHVARTERSACSVIICCFSFERFEESLAAIRSVQGQSLTPIEIVVGVDNNRGLARALRHTLPPSISVLENNAVQGLSETRNVACRACQGDLVAFIDDDAVARSDWLERLIEPFVNPDIVAVGGRSVPDWERGEAPKWFPAEFEFEIGCTAHMELLASEQGDVRNVTGSNMAFRRSVLSQIGDWQRELGRGQVKTGGEEAELCLRIKSQMPDARIVFEPSAVVDHKVAETRSTLRYIWSYAFNEGIVRARLAQLAAHHTGQPLAGEQRFLRRLLDTSIPRRLRHFYRPENLLQVAIIVTNTALLGAGFMLGRLRLALDRT